MPGGLEEILEGLGGLGETLPDGGQPATVFRAYAEVQLGSAPLRRFLLQLDPSEVTANAAVVLNHLDIDAANPKPDLTVRVTPNQSADGLTIELKPMPDRTLEKVSLFVFLSLSMDVFPAVGPAPDPAPFAYIGYTGKAGEAMPPRITAVLRQQVEGADDLVDLKLSMDGGADPTTIHGGTFSTTVALQPAVQTLFALNVYTELPAVSIRTGNRTTAPSALTAELDLRSHGGGPLDMAANAPLRAVIATPHASVVGRTPPTVALAGAGAGAVDAGEHSYSVNFRLANGNETGTTDASAVIDVADPAANGKVRLTGLPTPAPAPVDDPGVAAQGMRIYRSKAGDSGERFLVEEVPATTTEYVDDTADDALGPVPKTRMKVTLDRPVDLDIAARIDTRDPGRSNRIEADLFDVPDGIVVDYTTTPAAGRGRVTYQAEARFPKVVVRLPSLDGDYDRAEARIHDLPDALGVDWLMESPTRMRLELGGIELGQPAEDVGSLAALLSHGVHPWREALQTVVVELVERRSAPQTIQSQRIRAAVRGLRRIRFALGEDGHRHSRLDEGIVAALELGPDPGLGKRPPQPGQRSLRMLRVNAPPAAADHSHLLVRAGHLPDEMTLDLRAATDYFGVEAVGILRRLKVLSLERPTVGSATFAADGMRVWLTVPETPERIDFVNEGDDRVLDADAPTFAEVSLRKPDGFGTTPPLIRHIKAAARVPAQMRLAPETLHYGTADAGSTAESIADTDPAPALPADLAGLTLRFLTGPLTGQRRAITGGSAGAAIETAAFTGAPSAGDRYAVEGQDGITLETAPAGAAGPGVDARLALSTEADRLLAARATPQLKLRNLAPDLHSATARVYGLRELNLRTPADFIHARAALDPARRNTALRAQIIELDTLFAPADRDTMKIRIAALPDVLTFSRDERDPAVDVSEVTASAVTGPGVMWSEPGVLRTDGPRAGSVAGIGLSEFSFDRLPRRLRTTTLKTASPPNFPAPAGWVSSGSKFETSDDFRLSNVWTFTWDRDHPTETRTWWSESKIPFLAFDKTGGGELGALTLWTPSERPAADPEAPEGGLGFLIDANLLVTLDLNSFTHDIPSTGALRWDALGGDRSLAAELQMKDYRGEVTVATPLGTDPAGDEDAGPGLWFLRIVDGRPWYIGFGSVYFGNTGGIITSRPRIFA